MERDALVDMAVDNKNISTHTLTWSVTKIPITQEITPIISTHTLTWSVTIKLCDFTYINVIFQLTRSRGA